MTPINSVKLEALAKVVSKISPVIEERWYGSEKFQRKYRDKIKEIDSLSIERPMGKKIVYLLAGAGLTTPEAICKRLTDKSIFKLRNFGFKSYVALCKWLEIPEIKNGGQTRKCPCCGGLVK